MAAPGMLGIDVGKEKLVARLIMAQGQKTLWEMETPNAKGGVDKLLRKTPAGVPWVIEPTGRYSVTVVKQALAADRVVLMAPPRKAKAFLNSLQDRAKTDRLDARGLALFGLARDVSEPLQPYPVKKECVEKVDQMLSARKGLARALSSLGLQAKELPHAREALEAAMKGIQEQIAELDEQIAALMEEHGEFKAQAEIDRVPGIGPVTASAVTARLAAKSFRRPDEFVAYVGYDIGVVQSGKRKGEKGITHQGDAELRRLFFLCAQASIRAKDSPFTEQYERELTKGMSKTAALCAVARKMVKLCWSLHTHGASYDRNRVYQQPAHGTPVPTGDQPVQGDQDAAAETAS